jgi:multidrug resistance efflux pump
MDEARLGAEAAVVAAEVDAVRCELEFDLAGRRLDSASDHLRFAADVASSRLRVLEILAVLEPDRVTVADLERDVASYRELLAQELVSERKYQRVEAEHDALARRVAEHESLLARARTDLEAAEARADALATAPAMADDQVNELAEARVLSARVTALERRLEAVWVRRDDLVLTAPFDGVVTQIPACPGQVVRPGEPVLAMVEAQPQQIVVWLAERAVRQLQQRGDLEAIVVQDLDGHEVRAACPVARVGVSVETMPSELWAVPSRPERGRPVVLGVPPDLRLVPGERVMVKWG